MDSERWAKVLIEWVNCLNLCQNINSVKELGSCEFFANLQKVITKSSESQLDTLTFIFELLGKHYPNYSIANKSEVHLSDLPEADLRAVTSLLMHYTCIYDRSNVLTSPLCHSLSQSTQLLIRNFLQKTTNSVSNPAMSEIVITCVEEAAGKWLCVSKDSPLQDLLHTPASKYCREKLIAKLKSDLETERYDKADLQEEVKQQVDKSNRLEQQLAQRTAEVARLRGEVSALENRTPPHYQDVDSRDLQRRLRAEIQSQEDYIRQVDDEQEELRKENDAAKEMLRRTQVECAAWEEKFFQVEREHEGLSVEARRREEVIESLQAHCNELSALLEEYRQPRGDSSLYDTFCAVEGDRTLDDAPACEDLARSVVEVQLREAQKQNGELLEQMEQLRGAVEEMEGRLRSSGEISEELIQKIKYIELDKDKLQDQFTESENNVKTALAETEKVKKENQNFINRLLESTTQMLSVVQIGDGKRNFPQWKTDDAEEQMACIFTILDTGKESFQALESQRDDANTLSEKLQFELADTLQENEKLNTQFDLLINENESLLIKLQVMETAQKDLQLNMYTESQRIRVALEKQQHENHRLNRKLDENISYSEELKRNKAAMTFKLQQLNEKSDNLEQTNDKLLLELEDSKTQLTDALACLETTTTHAEEVSRQLANLRLEKQSTEEQMQADVEILVQEKSQLQLELRHAEEDRKELQARLHASHDEVKKTIQRLSEFESNLLRAETEKMNIQKNLCQLQENLKNANSLLETQLRESEVLRKEFECVKLEKQSTEEQLQADVEILVQEKSQLHLELCHAEEDRKELQTRMHESHDEAKKTIQRLSEFESNLLRSETEAMNLQKDLCQLQENIRKAQHYSESRRDEIANLKNANSLLETQLRESEVFCKEFESVKLQLEACNNENGELRSCKAALETRFDELKFGMGELVERLRTEEEFAAQLKREKDELQRRLDDEGNERNKLMLHNSGLERQLADVSASSEFSKIELKRSEAEKMALEKQVEGDKRVLVNLQTLLASLKEDFENLKFADDKLMEKWQESEINSLQLRKDKEALLDKLEESDSRNGELLSSQKTFVMELESVKAAFKRQHQSGRAETEALREKLDNLICEKEEVVKASLRLKNENDDLLGQLDATEKEKEVLLMRSANFEEELSETLATLQSSKVELSELKMFQDIVETRLRQTEELVVELKTVKTKLEVEKNDLEMKMEDCERIRNSMQTELHKIRSLSETAKVEVHNLESDNKNLVEKLQESEVQSQKLQEEKKVLLTKVYDLEKRSETVLLRVSDFEQHSDELRTTQSMLETRLSQTENAIVALEGHNAALVKHREETIRIQVSLKTDMEDLKVINQNLDRDLMGTRKQVQELEEQKKVLSSQLFNLEAKNEQLLFQMDDLQKQLNEASRDLEGCLVELKNENTELTAQLKQSNDNKARLAKELTEAMAVGLENISEEFEKLSEQLGVGLESLLSRLERVQGRVREVTRLNEELRREKRQLVNKLANIELERREFKGQVGKLQVDLEVELKRQLEARVDLENVSSILERLHERERDMKNLNEELSRQKTQVVGKLANVELENREIREKVGQVQLDLKVAKEESDELKRQLDAANHDKTTLSSQVHRLQKENDKVHLRESDLEVAKLEIDTLVNKLEQAAQEKTGLEKKIEVEEFVVSQTLEKIKALEETIQDYEITISGLKSVIDTNLENVETLKKELTQNQNQQLQMMRSIANLLLQENEVECPEQADVKSFVFDQFAKLLVAKKKEEQSKLDLENENVVLKTALNKLQLLIMNQGEVESFDVLKASFEKIHAKVTEALAVKQKLTDTNHELVKQLEEVVTAKTGLEHSLIKEREKVISLNKELENRNKVLLNTDKENILGVSTKPNKSREEELKKENMMLKRKVVLTENARNNLEKVLKEMRQEKKVKVEVSAPSEDVLYKKLLQEYIQLKEENERFLKEKDELVRKSGDKGEEDKKLVHDLQNIREAYGNLMSTNSKLELEVVTLRKVIQERNRDVSNMTHIKEAYEKLLEENSKVLTEVDTVKYKRTRDKEEYVRILKKERDESVNRESKKVQDVRTEYESKLEKMKEKMLQLYREEVSKKVKPVKDDKMDTETLFKAVGNLRAELFEADQKIEMLVMENAILKTNRTGSKKEQRAVTLPRSTVTEHITISRRTSIGAGAMSAQNLQMEDEEDLFNDKYLTDLKEGHCALPSDRESSVNRFSELAWRNSMVPPHLKSSYPAELQFISPGRFKDDDIKAGNIELEDSLCRLLPGEKPRKKDFGTTSYKRPGPPTPSKNGGRLSLQGNEVHPLREHCEAKTPKRSTPNRIKALFTGRNSESTSNMTPNRGRRLNIFRKPK